MTKIDEANRIMQSLQRQYPFWPSTFGNCSNGLQACESARGAGKCSKCLEKELAGIVGKKLANTYHLSLKLSHQTWCDIVHEFEGK